MQIGDIATFKLGTGIKSGVVSKINHKTIHVKVKDGRLIKRHVDKHVVSTYSMPEAYNDQIHKDTQFSDIGQS